VGNHLLALDAGTGSVRAVLFDEAGNQARCAAREWTHKEDGRWPGSMDFDWERNWRLAADCVREALAAADPASVLAVSTTCMREGFVLYDKEGREIWACANVDARSGEEVRELISLDPELEKKIYAVTGQTYALGALPRLLWLKNKLPEIYEKAAAMSMINDWLVYRLTGVIGCEPSNASTTGMFSLEKRDWAPETARACGLKSDILPKVYECGAVMGAVSAKGARETGLPEGVPVVAGGGDAQLGCVGVGAVKPGQAVVFGGSFWQYEFNTADAAVDKLCRVRVNCHAVPGCQYEAIAFQPGLVLRWYRDAFCRPEVQRASKEGKDPYYYMDQEAAKIPAGCGGMLCAFSDVMNYISWKHAAPSFLNFGLDPERYNRYTFYRSILENAALVTRGHLELTAEAAGGAPSEIIFAGGASKSPLWCQILSDTLGLPVKVPVVKEASALGAAIMAGRGAGVYPDIALAAEELVKWDKLYEPDRANQKIYAEAYARWRTVYADILKMSDSGLLGHMWRAPGL